MRSPLSTAPRYQSPNQSSRDGYDVDLFIVHHGVVLSLDVLLGMFGCDDGSPSKQVSANYGVGPFGIVNAVDENRRAFTSGSSTDGGKGARFDKRAITVETVNSTLAPNYQFNNNTMIHLAKLIADCATRHNFPIDADHVLGHRDLWTRYRASYATACPGPSMNMEELRSMARFYQQIGALPTAPKPQEEDGMTAADADRVITAIRGFVNDRINDAISVTTREGKGAGFRAYENTETGEVAIGGIGKWSLMPKGAEEATVNIFDMLGLAQKWGDRKKLDKAGWEFAKMLCLTDGQYGNSEEIARLAQLFAKMEELQDLHEPGANEGPLSAPVAKPVEAP